MYNCHLNIQVYSKADASTGRILNVLDQETTTLLLTVLSNVNSQINSTYLKSPVSFLSIFQYNVFPIKTSL